MMRGAARPKGPVLLAVLLIVSSLAACGDKVVTISADDTISDDTAFENTGSPAGADTGTGGGGDKTGDGDTGGGDTGGGDWPVVDEQTDPELLLLEFDQAFGDDSVPCKGTDHCSIYISFAETRHLGVSYTLDGEPVPNAEVHWELVNDAGSLGHINTYSSPTDYEGVAQVEVTAEQNVIGQFGVHAWVDKDGVNDLWFDVLISPKGQVPLTVVGEYNGLRPVSTWYARLYSQDHDAQPDCGDLEDLYGHATANWQSPVANLKPDTQSIKKQEFPGLEEDGSQTFTILAYAKDPVTDAVLAWGCDSVHGVVTHGYATTVHIELVDRPPLYAGPYTTHTVFNLISALPPPIDGYVESLLDIFKSPVGGLLSLMCDLGNLFGESILTDVCGFVFDDPQNPDVDDLSGTGYIVVEILDAVIAGLAQGTIAGDVLTGGKDVADVLTGFEVDGTITFFNEPDAQGDWAQGEVEETWDGVTIKWSLGANCDPLLDTNCGKKHYSFAAIQADGPPISTELTAHVEEFWDLSIPLHSLNVHYGVLINFIIEKVLLPLLAGDGSDGLPVVDSYEEFFYTLLAGKECLDPQFGMTCCASFAENVISSGADLLDGIIEGACEALVELGSDFIRDQLGALDVDTGEVMQIGTLEPCPFIDADNDMVIDGFGSQSKPCSWDVQLDFFIGQTTIDAVFWGVKAD